MLILDCILSFILLSSFLILVVGLIFFAFKIHIILGIIACLMIGSYMALEIIDISRGMKAMEQQSRNQYNQ